MAKQGFAVAAFRDGAQWRVEAMPPTVLGDLGVLLQALRAQPPEGGPFLIACVPEEFFVLARQEGRRVSLVLSDLTAAVEFDLAEQVLTRLGEEPPADDELDEAWPIGDLELFDDLDVSEEEMEDLLEDDDALPEEMVDALFDRLGLRDEYERATQMLGVGR
ncbi:MAG: tRNA adenosine deaminase-associated protein [Jatrophihabitans sp.]|uniref:tRNA adenosine deaminase-associated protein n=1 Tax=Jatrophihabitans sp. TaxID=1932789 RepID=UPI003F7EB696